MINFLGSLICQFRGHRWSRKKLAPLRTCSRCGITAPVKPRKPKPASAHAAVTEANQTRWEGQK